MPYWYTIYIIEDSKNTYVQCIDYTWDDGGRRALVAMFNCYYGNEVQQGHLRRRCLSIKLGRLSGALPVWFQHHEGKVLST